MTISISNSVVTLLGDGVTTVFNFNFIYASASSIQVVYTDSVGTQTTLLPTQYTLNLNPPASGQIWGIGGSVTYPLLGSPIATGTSVTIRRNLSLTQSVSISNQGDFYPQVVEAALDRLCMEIQQVAGRFIFFSGEWAPGNDYTYGDVVIDGANGENTGNFYGCVYPNTSGVWADDLAAGYWILEFDIQPLNLAVATAVAAAATATTEAGIATTQASNASSSASSASTSASTATTQAGIATTQAGLATTQAGNAAASAVDAVNFAAGLIATSTTSLAIATGSKSFTTQSGKQFAAGQFILAVSGANSANYMHGQVTSYGGTALVVNVLDIGGSGTKADWNLSVSGTQGAVGSFPPLTNTHIYVGNVSNIATDVAISGDATMANTGALTIANNAVTLPKIATQAANTFLANGTAGSASPTAIALAASNLAGRGSSGNITAITLGSGLSMDVNVLSSTVTATPTFAAINGFLPSSIAGTSTTASLTVSAGQATDTTGAAIITKASTTAWAVSNGNAINGYSGGTTLPNSSTIHFYICTGGTGTGVYAIPNSSYPLAAASAPSGYNTSVRRIFSLTTTGAGALVPIAATEIGGGALSNFFTSSIPTDANTTVGTTRTAFAMTAPLGIVTEYAYRFAAPNNATSFIVSALNAFDAAPATYNSEGTNPGFDADNGYNNTTRLRTILNTSAQLGVRASGAAEGFLIFGLGFIDFRRN